jgi:hypothetical protein
MKYHREHIDTFTPKAAKAFLIDLGIDHLPRRGDDRFIKTDGQGQYIMVLAKDGNYDVLYEHYNFGGR